MLINITILIIVFILIFFLSMIWPPDSPWAPWWRTNKETALAICNLASISKKDVIYDLGCGDGEVLIQSGRLGARGVGIEIDPFRVWVARLRMKFNNLDNKIIIKKENFFNEQISDATIIIVYLVPATLNKLVPKFKKELKRGTRIISYIYEIDGFEFSKRDKKHKLTMYTI